MGFFDFIGDAIGAVSKTIAPEVPLLSAGLGFLGQQSTNESNQAMAGATNATSIELANTAMQRKVTDLKAAGLNPMLAYSQGGSPVPQLQTSRNENPVAAGAANELLTSQIRATNAQAQASSAQAVAATAQAQKTQAETSGSKAQSDISVSMRDAGVVVNKVFSEINLNKMQEDLVQQEVSNAVKTGNQIQANTGNIQADTALKKIAAKLDTLKISEQAATSDAYTVAQQGAHKVGSMLSNSAESAGKTVNDIQQSLENAKSNVDMLPARVLIQRGQK